MEEEEEGNKDEAKHSAVAYSSWLAGWFDQGTLDVLQGFSNQMCYIGDPGEKEPHELYNELREFGEFQIPEDYDWEDYCSMLMTCHANLMVARM